MKFQKTTPINLYEKDVQAHFEGWDFSYLNRRMVSESPPWNYIALARRFAKNSRIILDIDTGGGEVLSKILTHNQKSFAIESYKPNVTVARRNLKQQKVRVVEADSGGKFPFATEKFDLILNRHGGINAKEIHRTLKKEGIFCSPQVDTPRNLVDLIKVFGGKPKWTLNNLKHRTKEFEKLGFKILKSRNYIGSIIFKDVGAIVYFLKSTAWLIDDFSPKKFQKQLALLEKRLKKKGELKFTLANFLLIAKKVNQ